MGLNARNVQSKRNGRILSYRRVRLEKYMQPWQ